MIRVDHFTKRFGRHVAVSDASFEVEKGAVLGFLGRNGAGKSTTMRVLSCFLRPTAGRVEVGGHDVIREPHAVRRLLGYLPENNPLYTEMKVGEYLLYRAALKGVESSRRASAVGKTMKSFGLVEVEGKVIGHLSRGFRQRVGFADVLVHDPEILILDEPTVGLDPNQIQQVREMIRGLAGRHTVIISTHILQEVEAVCDRVIIIDQGRIVMQETLDDLRRNLGASARFRAEIRGEKGVVLQGLRGIPGARSVEEEGEDDGFGLFILEAKEGADLREPIFRMAVGKGWSLRELRMEHRTMEQIFMEITQGKTEEGGAGS